MGNFWDFLVERLLGAATGAEPNAVTQTIDLKALIDQGRAARLAVYELALQAGVNLIANLVTLCEVRTFLNHQEIFGDEYYLFNFEPNANENASQFWHRLVERLLIQNECLVVPSARGELLIAESYVRESYALFPDVFRDVTVGGSSPYTFQRSFRANEVFYFRLNNQPLKALLAELEAEYSELVTSAVAKFHKSAGEHGVLSIDANMPNQTFGNKPDGSPRTFNDVYAEMMTKQFKDYFKSPNAVMTLWDGFKYDTHGDSASKKSTSDVKDITDLRDQAFEAVASALLIPPSVLKGTVAETSDLRKDLLANAVDPIANLIARELNRKRNGKASLDGTYLLIDTTRAQHIDVFGLASNIDKLRGASVLSVNEIRRHVGEPKIGEAWADEYALTKNYESVSSGPNSGTE